MKEQFHALLMAEGTNFFYHLSILNRSVTELEAIGVKIKNEDKALRLLCHFQFPTSSCYLL